MAEIASLPTTHATANPASVFDHPAEVVEHILLTRGQKLATLARWREQAAEQVLLANEAATYSFDAAPGIIADIDAAEAALREPVDEAQAD